MTRKTENKQVVTPGIKLEIADVIQLNYELMTLQKEKDLSFTTKYDLVLMYEKTRAIVRNYNQVKTDLIKEYGKESKDENGEKNWTLIGSKQQEKGLEELKALNEKKENFNFKFKFEDFEDLQSDQPYIQIMKFINK